MKKHPLVFTLVLTALMPVLEQAAAQAVVQTPSVTVKITQPSAEPQAVAIAVKGDCQYSEDGVNFVPLKRSKVLNEGFVVRTAEGARLDLFFRRIGTTVRLQPGTEVKLERMSRVVKDSGAEIHTLVDLRKGRIFTVVRSFVEGSTFEIRNAAGRAVVEGGGKNGRYIITADGTHVSEKDSAIPLKLIGETGITVITPGQRFDPKEGKVFSVNTPEDVETMIEFDELSAAVEQTKFEDDSGKPAEGKP